MSYDINFQINGLKNKSKLLSEQLNLISKEIKTIEHSLNESKIGINVEFQLNNHLSLTSEERGAFINRNIPGWNFINAYIESVR